jgi:hypothetical protein
VAERLLEWGLKALAGGLLVVMFVARADDQPQAARGGPVRGSVRRAREQPQQDTDEILLQPGELRSRSSPQPFCFAGTRGSARRRDPGLDSGQRCRLRRRPGGRFRRRRAAPSPAG